MLKKKPFSGPGAAHLGSALFGMRGPLRAPEDSGNGAGGSGAQPPQQQQVAPAEQPASPSITPEIRALIADETKKAKDAAFAEARRMFEGKSKGDPKPRTEAKTETNNADETSSLLDLRDAFDDATSEMKLSKGQRKILREAVMSKRPGDVDTFVTDFAAQAGWVANGGTGQAVQDPQVKNPPANGAQQPSGRPLSDHGSPAGAPAEHSTDILKWSSEDIERFYQKKGGFAKRGEDGELDVNVAANSQIHRELRTLARQRLANVRVQLGRRTNGRA